MARNEKALYYFHQGTNYESYRYLGSHPLIEDGISGVVFRVWAPKAREVSVVGDFTGWDLSPASMHRIPDSGIWECFIPGVQQYDRYKYKILSAQGTYLYKADPYAFHSETAPGTASKYYDVSGYSWGDDAWTCRDTGDVFNRPMNIYEVHLGSWRRYEDGNPFSFRDLAEELPAYASEMGYTHLEFMPVSEFPYDGSWGYQVTGYFAPTSRYGTPEDFMYLIDKCHQAGLGVILDWVPAHFPKDAHGLFEFDGSYCYEDSNPLRMEHKEWGTRIFDFGKPEVISFLISSAAAWLDLYHADGLRVDAVASMLYLDYDRKPGEWSPNTYGSNENLEAVSFLQKLNTYILTRFPKAIMAAEESTSWPMVTKPSSDGGLGFNFKWNMGWMNDSLSYIETDPLFRKGIHSKLTFSLMYAFNENFILPISHDEVVHGKRSMINKMPDDYEGKFEDLKTFYAYMYAHPGKKLTFMGNEFAQFIEWRYYEELDWLLLDYDKHRQFRDYIRKLNHLYRDMPEFWQKDCSWDGFKWINADDNGRNTLSFLRTAADGSSVLCVFNFSASTWKGYILGAPVPGEYEVLLDSASSEYGGTRTEPVSSYTAVEDRWIYFPASIKLDLKPMSAIYLKVPQNAKGE